MNQIVNVIFGALGTLAVVAGVLALAFVLVPGAGPAAPPTELTGPTPEFAGLAGDFSRFIPPRPVPAIGITDGTGRPFDLSSFRRRVVLLNLWATWCGPCVREMPALDRLQAELGGAGFAVVALSLDRKGREVVEPFFGRLGLDHLDMYFASARATVDLGARGLPTTFLIDHRGRLVGSLVGPAEWDSPPAKALIRHYMGLVADGIETVRPLPSTAPSRPDRG